VSGGTFSLGMGVKGSSSRRIAGGDALARVLLDAGGALTFDDLLAAAPDATPGDVAAWVGHALDEGLLWRTEEGFVIRARGRRLLTARRRSFERS
jgi:hypothetical protein